MTHDTPPSIIYTEHNGATLSSGDGQILDALKAALSGVVDRPRLADLIADVTHKPRNGITDGIMLDVAGYYDLHKSDTCQLVLKEKYAICKPLQV